MSPVERWEVKCGVSDIRRMTLDELDAAFEAGHVGEATLVRREGAGAWATLAEVAGLAADAPRTPDSLAPAALDTTPWPVDIDAPSHEAFKPSRRPVVIGGLVGAAVLAAATVFLFTRPDPAAPTKAAAAAPPPVAATLPSKTDAQADVAEGRALTEEQKRALAEADRKREAARKLRVQKEIGDRPAPRRAPEKSPFITGGAPGDPLSN